MPRRLIALSIALAMAATAPAIAAKAPPASWDGLTLVKSKKLDAVYLLPGADFRTYTKVMIDPTEVAFQKNWVRDYNSQTIDLGSRMSDSDAQKILDAARTGFEEIFSKAYTDAGYQVVTAAGPDVMRVRTAVVNLQVSAPDLMTANRSRSYSQDAGAATMVLEVRDSVTGAIMGRAVDGRIAGDNASYIRNRVTNRADFEQLFRTWAKAAANGLAVLKEMSPIPGGTQTAAK